MSEIFKLEANKNWVTLLSADRMPHNSRKSRMDSARRELRKAIFEMTPSEGEIIEGVYSSQVEAYFDIENVVFYNLVPSTFRQSAKNGLRARRCRINSGLQNPKFPHKMDYQIIPIPELPSNPSICLSFTPNSLKTVFNVWWSAGTGQISGDTVTISGRYGLYVTLNSPHPPSNPAGIMKVLFDGIIASLQKDATPDTLAVERLSRIYQIPEALIEQRLREPIVSAVPASRSTHLVRPYRMKVQWHPADDLCEECTLIVRDSLTPTCNAYIYNLV